MIRNKIDGQDMPMKVVRGPYGADILQVDEEQLRLEHDRCPVCPMKLRYPRLRNWRHCSCCGRMWRKRSDGRFDEQLPIDTAGCLHWQHPLAGSQTWIDPGH